MSERRRITLTVTVACETDGDASLDAIKLGYERSAVTLPFIAGSHLLQGSHVLVTRARVDGISEQDSGLSGSAISRPDAPSPTRTSQPIRWASQVTCPACDAGDGVLCRTESGQNHPERNAEWQRQMAEQAAA